MNKYILAFSIFFYEKVSIGEKQEFVAIQNYPENQLVAAM